MLSEIVSLGKRTEKAKFQSQQELKDKEIIINDISKLFKIREKITSKGKAQYRKTVTGEKAKHSAFQSLKAVFSFSSATKQVKPVTSTE
jgi:hypothetical protein